MRARHVLLALLTVSGAGIVSLPAQTMRSFTTARGTSGERQLRATLDFGAGLVRIQASSTGHLYRMQAKYDADRYAPVQQYEPRTGILHLGLESVGKGGVRVTSRSQLEQMAVFEFSPTVPLALSANFGAAEAELDLGGLTLSEVTVRSGASRGRVIFSRPTQGDCRTATFSVGATELDIRGLGNAACTEVRVEGGVGKATLDFGGSWRRNVAVAVDLKMGAVTLRIPKGTGVRLITNRFLSTLSAEGFTKDGKTWTTPGFDEAPRKVTVELKTAVAGVGVEWL